MYFYSLSSGSSGNCIHVGSDKTKLLIDIGLSKKKVEEFLNQIKLKLESIAGILITHEHSDHCKGLKAVDKLGVPIYLNEGTYNAIKQKGYLIKNVNIIEKEEFSIGDLDIKMFKVPHDAADPVGYTLSHKGRSVSVATDIGYVSGEVFRNIKDSHLILLESNYNEKLVEMGTYPRFLKERILSKHGHLSNEECGNTVVDLIKNSHKTIVLGHISDKNNYPELAYKTVEKIVCMNGFKVNHDLDLRVAERYMPSNLLRV